MSKVKETFDLVRNSPELGRFSCSSIDECWEDSELTEEIETYFHQHPDNTPEQYFNQLCQSEGLYWERQGMQPPQLVNDAIQRANKTK